MNNKNEQKNISNDILQKISEQNIAPKPKWEFLIKNAAFWTFGAITVLFGASAIAASIFVFKNIRWDIYNATHDNLFTFTVEFLPHLWIILFIVFIFFTQKLIRKTKQGYKYNIAWIAGITLVASLFLGVVFAQIGIGKAVDESIGNRIPFHRGIERHNQMLWNRPTQGFLSGTITVASSSYTLTTNTGLDWDLEIATVATPTRAFLEQPAMPVRLIGFEKAGSFYVCAILPEHSFERKIIPIRTTECERVRPYNRLLQ